MSHSYAICPKCENMTFDDIPCPCAYQDDETVNHPKHYTSHPSGVECIQITEHMDFVIGNIVKYAWRAGLKEDRLEDLKKCLWYAQRAVDREQAAQNPESETPLQPPKVWRDWLEETFGHREPDKAGWYNLATRAAPLGSRVLVTRIPWTGHQPPVTIAKFSIARLNRGRKPWMLNKFKPLRWTPTHWRHIPTPSDDVQ